MTISYSRQDLERWAAFSGDYNPVHFDDEIARSAGMPGRIVHGMLAMMTMKDCVLLDEAGHTRVSFSIKKPMTLTSQYKTTAFGGSHYNHVYLTDIDERERFIRCKYKPINDDCFIDNDLPHIGVPAARLQQKYRDFRATYQDVRQAWSFYDALIFNEYMDSITRSHRTLAEALYDAVPDHERPPAVRDMVVMHVFHDIRIHAALVGAVLNEAGAVPAFAYTVAPREVLHSEGDMYVVLRFTCFFDGVPLLLIDLGLMVHAS